MQVKNPIPKSNLFANPTLEQIATQIEGMPAEQKKMCYLVYALTLNACNALAQTELERMADMLERV